jgi:hypothetical protein
MLNVSCVITAVLCISARLQQSTGAQDSFKQFQTCAGLTFTACIAFSNTGEDQSPLIVSSSHTRIVVTAFAQQWGVGPPWRS